MLFKWKLALWRSCTAIFRWGWLTYEEAAHKSEREGDHRTDFRLRLGVWEYWGSGSCFLLAPPPIIVLKLAALSPIMRVHILTNCFSLRKYSKLQKENQYKKYLGTDKQLKAAPGKKFLILAFFCLENLHRAEICLEYWQS